MQEPSFWSTLFASFGNPQSWIKFALLLALSPLWWPIARAFWRELQEALAPEGGIFGNRPRRAVARRPSGLDPFANLAWPAGRPGSAGRADAAEPAALEPVRRRGF